MGQETQEAQGQPVQTGQPQAESGETGKKPQAMQLVVLDPSRSPTELMRDLLVTGGYPAAMAAKVGTDEHAEIRLTEAEAKEMQYGNTELTVTLSGETKDELAKNNTLVDGNKFKHAYNRLKWEDEVKRMAAEFVGDKNLDPGELAKQKANYEVDGYRVVSLLASKKLEKVADIFANGLYPKGSNPIPVDEIDVKDNVFKGMGALTTISGTRFMGASEVSIESNPIAESLEKPGVGLFEFTAPFTQLGMLKWFYTGVTDVERKAFIVFDLAQIGKTTHYERSENRVPQIGRFTFFETSPGVLREDDPNKLKVADLTTAEPYNVPLTLSLGSDEIDTFGLNHDLGILMVNNIVMYNNQYGKPFDRLGDHLANRSHILGDAGFKYVGEDAETSSTLKEAVANVPGYEDTSDLSSRVIGLSFRDDITLAQAYADKMGIIGNLVIPVEKANLANEFLNRLKKTLELKEDIIKYEAFEGAKDTDIFEASFTGDKDQDVTVIVKSTTTMLEVDDSKHNKITTSVDESTFLPHVKQIVKAMFNLEFPIVDIVEDTEYEHEHAKVYEIKPKAAFANVSTGKKIRLVYMKAENPSASEEGKETPKPQEGGTQEQPSPPASGEEEQPSPPSPPQGGTEGRQEGGLVTELSGFTPPNN
nr:MAG TPA: hypothetical protein [Caudoviricetes sp.]